MFSYFMEIPHFFFCLQMSISKHNTLGVFMRIIQCSVMYVGYNVFSSVCSCIISLFSCRNSIRCRIRSTSSSLFNFVCSFIFVRYDYFLWRFYRCRNKKLFKRETLYKIYLYHKRSIGRGNGLFQKKPVPPMLRISDIQRGSI